MNSNTPSLNRFKNILQIEDSSDRDVAIDLALKEFRKYATLDTFLECEDLFVELLLNYPSEFPKEHTLPQVIYTLTTFGSPKAQPYLYKMLRYKQPFELRRVVIGSYCYGYERGTKNKRLLERLFGYLINRKLPDTVRAASAGAMLYVYYNRDEITLEQQYVAADLCNFVGDIETHTPWDEIKKILEGVGSTCYQEFLLTELGQSVKNYEKNYRLIYPLS